MTRIKQEDEVVSLSEAAKRLGMTNQGLADWASRPGAPILTKSGRRFCRWPAFVVWFRGELSRREKPKGDAESKSRKLAAEAEREELDLARERGDLMPVGAVRHEMQAIVTRLRAQVLGLPARFAARTVGVASLPASQVVWEACVRDLLQGLSDEKNGNGDH